MAQLPLIAKKYNNNKKSKLGHKADVDRSVFFIRRFFNQNEIIKESLFKENIKSSILFEQYIIIKLKFNE